MLKLCLFVVALLVTLASAHSNCKLYLANSSKETDVTGGSKGGCYEVDPRMKIATISADSADVHFKFHSNANCKGSTVYTGSTSDTVITVRKFSAGSVQLTCPRKSRR
ncbi:hypothetical protein K450DRAFT_259330 [Umbelopsis ramanniana AG]|uniref:Uncharacterized protein n=1 Tax=Umbelopsis ramanniana AG TaxID=1314678 RepID=A0AAD5E3P7_UMBRA|nr:uncharacterized protein K450DRAFT_259330 [Umbelopsis ramanniana AG]KAI8575906.1 hypothetical protein K450DRAFT_259330 [Umbelopsis ramanniana AG]